MPAGRQNLGVHPCITRQIFGSVALVPLFPSSTMRSNTSVMPPQGVSRS